MDMTSYLLVTAFKGVFGVVLLLAAYLLFDRMTPDYHFANTFEKPGISGGAVIVAAFMLAIALIVSGAAF